MFFYQGQKEIDNVIFFLADQPEVESEVIDCLINDDHDGTKILIPQYRYKLGFPILVPRLLNDVSIQAENPGIKNIEFDNLSLSNP